MHILKDNIIEFAVLEQVNEPDNIGMLTHLQNLYLSSLLVYLNLLHVLLVDGLYRDFLAILFVRGKLYEAKLAFTKVVLEIIEVKHVCVPNRVPEVLYPFKLQILVFKVKQATLVRWKHYLHWVEIAALALT